MTTDERTANFTTSCEPCVFAQWEYDGRNTQSGCDLKRLAKYKSKGKANLTPGEFYIIDTICNTCRGKVWADQHLGENLISVVEKEIAIQVDFILMSIDDNSSKVLKLLPNLLAKCVNQKQIKPHQILVVLRNNAIESQDVYNVLKENCADVEYRLIRIVDFSSDILRCLDMAVQKCGKGYYAIFDLCNNIPVNLISTLNDLINNQLKPLSMVEPICCNMSGLIVQTSLHRIFGGNRVMPIYDKIREAAKIQEREDYIYSWEQLWINPK